MLPVPEPRDVQRGNLCKFRHLEQDHPDAIADRVHGHVSKLVGRLPPEEGR